MSTLMLIWLSFALLFVGILSYAFVRGILKETLIFMYQIGERIAVLAVIAWFVWLYVGGTI